MKNKMPFLISILLMILSCKTSNREIFNRVEERETQRYVYNSRNDSPKMKKALDSTYRSFFSYRDKVIYNYIKQKNLKDFVLAESIDYYHITGWLKYFVHIATKDSVFIFRPYSSDSLSVKKLKDYNNNYSYLFKKDSLYITRDSQIDEKALRLLPEYFTHFNSKGKIDQLTINDSILYKKKGSKMVVDLSIEKWDIGTGEIYTRKNDTIELGTLKLANCIRDERSTPLRCDTLN